MFDSEIITDYLHTQGLRHLPHDEVAVAAVAAQTVLAVGQAALDAALVQCAPTAAWQQLHHAAPEQCARQVFLAVDAALSRGLAAEAAAVYLLLPESASGAAVLRRFAGWGKTLPESCIADDDRSLCFLAARVAQTGWLAVADTAQWLADGSLKGGQPAPQQLALPLCRADGSVLGVFYAAGGRAFDEAQLPQWIGLTLALAEYCSPLLPQSGSDAEN